MTIITGDCLEVMKTFPDNYFSGIVTDPPYGLHFMGKDWDHYAKGKVKCGRKVLGSHTNSEAHQAARYDEKRNDEFQEFIHTFAQEALRIIKPGSHLLMFGAPRRYHRQVCAIEDAAFEIRDCIMWLYGSGFPKSHNHFGCSGYGTALKPAYEPIIMAMKPCEGTFKQNYEKWGVGGINIDGCRIATEDAISNHSRGNISCISKGIYGNSCSQYTHQTEGQKKGRWPANLILDEEAGKMLDEQVKDKIHPSGKSSHGTHANSMFKGLKDSQLGERCDYQDSGGASRFFYCAKTSSKERNEGLEEFPWEIQSTYNEMSGNKEHGPNRKNPVKNHHPTVKPLSLMRYLITLISPPTNALILDPFAGSGSTIVAATQLGIEAIGIEKHPEYADIARARVAHAVREKEKSGDQMELFG